MLFSLFLDDILTVYNSPFVLLDNTNFKELEEYSPVYKAVSLS